MAIPPGDRDIVRRLAAEVAEIATLPVHREKADMWRRLNERDPLRPMVWINEICWNEMDVDGELTLECSDPFCRGIEQGLRRTLYQWHHLPADMIVEDVLYCPIAVKDTGLGIEEQSKKVYTAPGSVASRQFVPLIKEEADIQRIRMPEVSVDWEATERRREAMESLLGDLLRVEVRGIPGQWFAPWDLLIRWWGVQQAMMDLVMRPQMVHQAMDRLVGAYLHRLDQWEALDLLALNNTNVRVGSGGLGYTTELPSKQYDPAHVRARDLWGCATAQIFSEVSPEMHEEFALQYERRWLDRFGLTYYGCCEPLHHKIEMLRSLPNLRKISISPRADIASAAEQIGREYVISFKPNPALLAEDEWNPERVRTYLRESLAKARGCVVEVILKDISTVRFRPRRLWDWSRIAMEVVEEFAA